MTKPDDRVISLLDRLPLPPLKEGGGGGNSGGMEPRIAKLEAAVDDLRSDMKGVQTSLQRIEIALARMEVELSHKVDYKWLTVYVLGLVAVLMREEILAFFRGVPS